MKCLFTAMFICLTCLVSAQIVNIPDPVFKNELLNYSPVIDINQDGEIQVSEALAVHSLSLNSADLTGIREFANLDSLFSSGNTTNFDVSNMTNLKTLTESGTGTLNVSGCNNLQYLSFGQFNNLPDITISLPRLKIIGCGANQVGNMILTGCDSLKKLYFNEGLGINTLDVSGLTQIDTMTIGNINRLIARNCTGLKVIQAGNFIGSVRDELDVTGCTALTKIMLVEPSFPSLDLSTCSSMKILMISAQSGYLQNLNIKNGRQLDSIYLFCSSAPATPLNICADDFEADSVSHMITRNQSLLFPRPFIINSYCSFYPGGTYNTINGTIKLDLNNNGCDNLDEGMPGVQVKYTDTSGQSTVNYSAAPGGYSVYTSKGIFSVAPYFPYPYFTVSPASANVNFDTANNLISTNDFCITAQGVHNDLQVTFLPIGSARPGFTAAYRMDWKNRGNTVLSGDLQLQFDNSKENFSAATLSPASQTSGQLVWNYTNLQPFQSGSTYVYFDILPPLTNNTGDTLIYLAAINPVANDETPADNSFILPQRLVGAYDPNDKICAEGERISITDIAKPLHYVVNFQNLGTDTAFNVVVADTLANSVDWESFDFIAGSHPCRIKRKGNKLEFYFDNIKLPYQAINDAGSKGFVAFEVKPKNSLAVGDSINNTAAIYFDFNLPVITNKATTIVSLLSPLPVKLEYFSLTGKDKSNLLTWKVATTDLATKFEIERGSDGIHFNNIGNITATAQRCQLPFNFTDDKPLAGKNYYRLKITDANELSFYSKILVTGRTISGLEITAVVPDKNNSTLYLNASKDQTVKMKIIAADGRCVYSQSKTIIAGTNQLNIRTGNLSRGIYTIIVLTGAGEMLTKKFID